MQSWKINTTSKSSKSVTFKMINFDKYLQSVKSTMSNLPNYLDSIKILFLPSLVSKFLGSDASAVSFETSADEGPSETTGLSLAENEITEDINDNR